MNIIRFGTRLGPAPAWRFSECIASGKAAPNFKKSLRGDMLIDDRPDS
ncbi:MAG: hypothetical protein ACPHJ3_06815 [Rubripirellula sp.]